MTMRGPVAELIVRREGLARLAPKAPTEEIDGLGWLLGRRRSRA
jgi:hypothetical protein